MTYQGRVENGVVVLGGDAKLAEGTLVSVRPVRRRSQTSPRQRAKPRSRRRESLGDALLRFSGCVSGLPSDLARNHDHYLYGLPKK